MVSRFVVVALILLGFSVNAGAQDRRCKPPMLWDGSKCVYKIPGKDSGKASGKASNQSAGKSKPAKKSVEPKSRKEHPTTEPPRDTLEPLRVEPPVDEEVTRVDVPVRQPPGRTTINWVRIPGGTVLMGSSHANAYDWEQPVHEVVITGFDMSQSEVTVAQYKKCVSVGACTRPRISKSEEYEDCNWDRHGREDYPMNCVTWKQAQDFARWVGGRLPTESEWEYAARGGQTHMDYPWGKQRATCERAVMKEEIDGCGTRTTARVCSKAYGNTEQGLCDMSGNVQEWVQDWFHDSYDGAPDDGSAWEEPVGTRRVSRGGSIESDAWFVRAAMRFSNDPMEISSRIGFRVARQAL